MHDVIATCSCLLLLLLPAAPAPDSLILLLYNA